MSQPSYVDPGHHQPAGYGHARGTNTMAILSLVFAFVFAPLGIVFGHVARRQIRRTGEQGSGLATAGLWLGYIFTILAIASWVLLGVLIANSPETTGS
jgi:hypothetical protein